jgi:gas vesicle protein
VSGIDKERVMARDNGGEAGTIILAFVLGAVTGAAVALLMAPASGQETRRRLADRAREGADRAREVAGQGRDLWNRQRQTFANAVERGREAYQQARGAQPSKTPSGEPL